jgi:iron complex outermembrane receptor protein
MKSMIYGMALCAAALLDLTSIQSASAQTAQAGSADLTEVIVTARRIEERAQDVPISMTVLNQKQLADKGIVTASDLAAATPGLSVDSEFGQEAASFSIRGFAQQLQSTPSVAVYFADAVVPRGGNVGQSAGSGVAPGSFFDLENVQVLKGPQGTLFGRNTDGGAVLLVPRKPTAEFEGYVEGGFGNYAMHEVQAVLNLPISDALRVRVAVNDQTRNGFENNVSGIGPSDFENLDYTAARLSLVADITPNLENYTVAAYNLSVTNGILPQAFACNPAQPTGPTLCASTLAALQGKGPYAVANNLEGAESYLKQIQVVNTTSWEVSDHLKVKNIANYAELTTILDSGLFGAYLIQAPGVPGYIGYFTSTVNPRVIGAKTTDQYTWSDELQLSGSALDNKLNWQGGGYVERSGPLGDLTGTRSANFVICPDVSRFLCSGAGVVDMNLASVHWLDDGVFGQATYSILDNLKITGGTRYTWDRSTASVNSTNYAGFPLTIPGPYSFVFCSSAFTTPANNCAASFAQNSKAPTGTVDIDYFPTPDLLLYAKYSRGYRQGGVATFVADNYHLYNPEHVDSYELGEKWSFSGEINGTFDVTGHYNNFTDQQLLAGFTGPQVAPSSGIVNAGKSRIWGIELESTLQPVRPLTVGLSYSYLNTKLLSSFFQLPPGGAYNSIQFPTVAGGPLPFSPKNKLSANAAYTFPLPDTLGVVSLGANYTYTSGLLVSETAAPYGSINGYGLLGANLHWNDIMRSPVDVDLFVTNLTDKVYYNNVTQLYTTAFGLAGRYLGEPRMYGAHIRVRLGK